MDNTSIIPNEQLLVVRKTYKNMHEHKHFGDMVKNARNFKCHLRDVKSTIL